MSERSTVQRIGDLERMVTSFRRHLRAENKADQTITAYTYAPLQLAAFLDDRGMPTDVAGIHREHIESFLEDLPTKRSAATALDLRLRLADPALCRRERGVMREARALPGPPARALSDDPRLWARVRIRSRSSPLETFHSSYPEPTRSNGPMHPESHCHSAWQIRHYHAENVRQGTNRLPRRRSYTATRRLFTSKLNEVARVEPSARDQ
jgi:Phage integrase, N-terminal SAM-like domain